MSNSLKKFNRINSKRTLETCQKRQFDRNVKNCCSYSQEKTEACSSLPTRTTIPCRFNEEISHYINKCINSPCKNIESDRTSSTIVTKNQSLNKTKKENMSISHEHRYVDRVKEFQHSVKKSKSNTKYPILQKMKSVSVYPLLDPSSNDNVLIHGVGTVSDVTLKDNLIKTSSLYTQARSLLPAEDYHSISSNEPSKFAPSAPVLEEMLENEPITV